MNKLIFALVVIVLVISGFFVFNSYIYQEKQVEDVVSEQPMRDVSLDTFSDSRMEIAFDYLTGTDGYVIDDLSEFVGEEPQGIELEKVYRIMNTKEKAELENSEGGREGPPAIQLMIFDNSLNQSASVWVDAFPVFSNINMVLGVVNRDAVVGGANAVRYTTDGLYVTDNVVVAHGGHIYHFTGSYHEVNSDIHQDFNAIIDSVRFVANDVIDSGNNAKIDVKVACESALAYMTFPTGAAADEFVAECVEGKHPEVIDRYLEDLGVDGATI